MRCFLINKKNVPVCSARGRLQHVETSVGLHRSDSLTRPHEGHVRLARGTYCGVSNTPVCTTCNGVGSVIHFSVFYDALIYFKVPGTVGTFLTTTLTILPVVNVCIRY